MSIQSVDVEAVARTYDAGIIVRRWAATWIDFVVLGLLGYALLFGPEMLPISEEAAALIGFLLLFLVPVAYYFVLEALTGATLGKLILGIRVVDADGNPPGIVKNLVRTLFRLVEVNPFFLVVYPPELWLHSLPQARESGTWSCQPMSSARRILSPSGSLQIRGNRIPRCPISRATKTVRHRSLRWEA